MDPVRSIVLVGSGTTRPPAAGLADPAEAEPVARQPGTVRLGLDFGSTPLAGTRTRPLHELPCSRRIPPAGPIPPRRSVPDPPVNSRQPSGR